jgi:beta-1,4-N-acetylglucosaminyltransferase
MRSGRVVLVCSPGGHLLEMLSLEPAYRHLDETWVTLPCVDVEHLLAGRTVFTAHGPTNRSLVKLLRNLPLAWNVVRRHDPDVIIATGAGLAVPFFLIGRLLRRQLVYVESLARSETLSLTGRLVYRSRTTSSFSGRNSRAGTARRATRGTCCHPSTPPNATGRRPAGRDWEPCEFSTSDPTSRARAAWPRWCETCSPRR